VTALVADRDLGAQGRPQRAGLGTDELAAGQRDAGVGRDPATDLGRVGVGVADAVAVGEDHELRAGGRADLLGQGLQGGRGIDAAVGSRHGRQRREAAGDGQHPPGVGLPDLILLQVRSQEPGGYQRRQDDGHLHRQQLDRQREGASHPLIVPQWAVSRTTTNTTSTTATTRGCPAAGPAP
jgi:hypothetical protein